MRYVGSKNKISKYIVPIIQSYINSDTTGYIEPFVGGANVIDKINCQNKIGCDIQENLIELLKKAQEDVSDIPDCILEDEYHAVKSNQSNYPKWYVGLVGFCSSFGAKYFGGYARNSKQDNSGKWSRGAINNLKAQSQNISDIKFICKDFRELDINKLNGYVIYCDIPYKNTTKYATKAFPYEEFYEWCRQVSKSNTVLISEYNMPDDFKCILEIPHKTLLDSNKNTDDDKNVRIERLYIAS